MNATLEKPVVRPSGLVATTVMLSFISFWGRGHCSADLASSAYYVGGDRKT
jgi:hypothetical protein